MSIAIDPVYVVYGTAKDSRKRKMHITASMYHINYKIDYVLWTSNQLEPDLSGSAKYIPYWASDGLLLCCSTDFNRRD